jgi:hypothetical protein
LEERGKRLGLEFLFDRRIPWHHLQLRVKLTGHARLVARADALRVNGTARPARGAA